MSEEKIGKLTQDEIIALIRVGNLAELELAVWDRRIEVPQDLFNFKVSASSVEQDSALHVAARFGQAKIMQYLIAGLRFEVDKIVAEGEEPQKEIKTWAVDVSVKNINGEAAIDVVNGNNSFAEKKMIEMLEVAALPAGPVRDSNMLMLKEPLSNDILPKRSENFGVAWGNGNRYTGSKDEMGNVRDSAALYMQVRDEVMASREAKNKARYPKTIVAEPKAAPLNQINQQKVPVATGGGR